MTAVLKNEARNAVIAVSRYSGAQTATPLGSVVSGNANGINGLCAGGANSDDYGLTIPTTGNGGIVYGTIAIRQKSHMPGAGYTERLEAHQGTSGDAAGIAIMDKTATASSNVVINGTFSSDVDWAVTAIEIR